MEDLSHIHPDLVWKNSVRARRVALRLDNKERVMRLVVPKRMSRKKALTFAHDHRDWIHEKMATLPALIKMEEGVPVPVLGRRRTINISYDPDLKTTSISLKNNEIIILTNKKDPSARITRFLKDEARRVITELAYEKAGAIGKKIKSIRIGDTKTRWGSCGADGKLAFSWRLIFAPYESLDYLVAHEVAHLKHLNHGKKFWALCEELSADYETGKEWMRDHGHTLMRYGV